MISIELFPRGLLLCVESLEHLMPHLVSHELFFFQLLVYHRIFCAFKTINVNVNREQSHRLDASFNGDCVDLSAAILHFLRHDVFKGTRDEEKCPELLGSSFEPGRHVDIWREVRGINFEIRTNSTLNGPSLMYTETHLASEALDFF